MRKDDKACVIMYKNIDKLQPSFSGSKGGMNMNRRKIWYRLRNHKRLYAMAKFLRNWHNEEFCKLIVGYYEESDDFVSFMINRYGKLHPDVIVEHILMYPDGPRKIIGFMAIIRAILRGLIVADNLGFVPVVEIGSSCVCYDSGMDSITKNVFEYYFKPVSDISYSEVNRCAKVTVFNLMNSNFFVGHPIAFASFGYIFDPDEIKQLGEIYKKYIRLNEETENYIQRGIAQYIENRRTLGVHVRGTDFNVGEPGHPYVIPVEEYLNTAKDIFAAGNYEQIFLATDDANALAVFQKEFGSKLAYYTDTLRSSDNTPVQGKAEERPLHYYKLGLEVLRDVYTLAACDSLICGKSNVALAARYVKYSKDERYKVLQVIDHGLRAG